jgi:hypothetical protein
VVYIKRGTYNERIVPQNSGTPGNYITYAAYTGDIVTIDGMGISLPDESGLFHISDKNYIKISGLRIINAGPNDNNSGILVYNSSNIIIDKNYTYNTVSSGIAAWNSNNVIIDGNEVELACNDGEQECITVAETDTFEIKNNHIHHGGPGNHGGEGIDAKDGSTNGKIYNNHVHHLTRLGIYIDSWDKHTYGMEVFQNTVHDIIGGDGFEVASEAGGLLENIRIYNNIAYNNENCGITISRNGDSQKHPMKEIKIVNNTFYNNGQGDWGGGISIDNPDAENVVIKNNICSQNLLFQIELEGDVAAQNVLADHNLIDGYKGYVGEIYGTEYIEGDPKFANPSGADFHLQNGSSAIDSGTSMDAPNDDFDGNQRPEGSGYDIGAFEYLSSPVPDIKANSQDDPISVSLGTPISITVSLNPGNYDVQNADWWVVELTPSTTYNYFDLSARSMLPGLSPTHQGPLFSLGSTQLLNSSNLAVGTHTFYFAVDMNMNGSLDFGQLYFDAVVVNITQ